MNLQRSGDDLFVIQRDAVILLRGGKPDVREQIITLEGDEAPIVDTTRTVVGGTMGTLFGVGAPPIFPAGA